MINATAASAAAAATEEERREVDNPPEEDAEEVECGTCGEGIDGQEAGRRNTIRVKTPYRPSQEEVDDHDLTHLPYRSWCRHCIRGRGKETGHFQQKTESRTVPEFHMDFCYPGYEESATEYLNVLVVRMRDTRMTMSSVVPSKSVGEYTTNRIVAFLRECGSDLSKITIKTDQEPAILSIAEDLVRARAALGADETISENSVAYSHQSNGVVERGVQSVEGMVRTLRSALEASMDDTLVITDAIWP